MKAVAERMNGYLTDMLNINRINRYALQLADTIKITPEKGVCLTEGVKLAKDILFFLNADDDGDTKN